MENQDADSELLDQLDLIKNLREGASHRYKRESLETLKELYKYSRKTSLTRKTIIEIESAIEKLKAQCDRNTSHTNTDDSCNEFDDLTDGTSKSLRPKRRHTYGWRDHRASRRSRSKSPKETKFHRRLQNVISRVRSWTEYKEKRESFARYSQSNSEDENRGYRRQGRQRISGTPSNCYRDRSRSPFRAVKHYEKREESRPRYYRSHSSDGSDEYTERRSRSKRRNGDRYRRSRSQEKRREHCRLSKSRSPSRHWRVPIPKYFKEEDEKPKPTRTPWIEPNENCSTSSMDLESAPESHLNESIIDELRKKIQSTLAHSSNRTKSPVRAAEDLSRQHNLHGWQGEFDLDGESSNVPPENQVDEKTDRTEVQQEYISANLQVLRNDSKNLALDLERKKVQFTFAKSLKTDTSHRSSAFNEATTGTLADARSKLSTLLKSALVDRSDNDGSEKSSESPSVEEHSSIDNDSVDQEIIQKIVSQTQTSYELAVNVPMDFDSVKRAVATSKMLEEKIRSESQRFAGTSATQLVRKNHSTLQVSRWAYSPKSTYSYTGTPTVNTTTTQVLRTSDSSFLTTRVNLPIPSTKFLPVPVVPFQKPATPRYDSNEIKPKLLDSAFNHGCSHSSSRSKVEKIELPTTYGEYKSRIASRELLGKYKIPKKTPTMNPFTAPVSNAPVVKTDFQGYAEPMNIIDYDDNRLMSTSNESANVQCDSDSSATENDTVSKLVSNTPQLMSTSTKVQVKKRTVPPSKPASKTHQPKSTSKKIQRDSTKKQNASQSASNTYEMMSKSTKIQRDSNATKKQNDTASNPVTNTSKEETALTTLNAWMNTNQFATLVDLMQQLSQQKNLEKLKEALSNSNDSVTNEEFRGVSNTATFASNISVSAMATTGESSGKCNKQSKHYSTLVRSQLFSSTSNSHETNDGQTVKSVPDTATFKNIQLEWHSLRKILSCQICDKPHGNSLVSHYVNQHPNAEVLTSRLAPEAIECLRSGVDECKNVVVKRPNRMRIFHFKQFCYFCNVYKCFPKSAWIVHFARHTGYYRYKCMDCSHFFADKPQTGRCAKINCFEAIAQPQFLEREIMVYICELCNFVRCHKHEIEMHLSREHDEEDLTQFKETAFLTFPVAKRKRGKSGSKTVEEFLTNLTESDTENKTESDSEYETYSETDDSLSQCDSDWTNMDLHEETMSESESESESL